EREHGRTDEPHEAREEVEPAEARERDTVLGLEQLELAVVVERCGHTFLRCAGLGTLYRRAPGESLGTARGRARVSSVRRMGDKQPDLAALEAAAAQAEAEAAEAAAAAAAAKAAAARAALEAAQAASASGQSADDGASSPPGASGPPDTSGTPDAGGTADAAGTPTASDSPEAPQNAVVGELTGWARTVHEGYSFSGEVLRLGALVEDGTANAAVQVGLPLA